MNITMPVTIEFTPEEVSLLVLALGELPAKHSRGLLNKVEGAIVRAHLPPTNPEIPSEPSKLRVVSDE